MQIQPVGKNTINHEAFAAARSAAHTTDDCRLTFCRVWSDDEVSIVYRILATYQRSGYLRPRTKGYLDKNRHRFYVTAIDGIVAGCVERKVIDHRTVELGALAINSSFRNRRLGVYTVNSLLALMKSQGYTRFISLTNNPRLKTLFTHLKFVEQSRPEYQERQAQSPNVRMFVKVDRQG